MRKYLTRGALAIGLAFCCATAAKAQVVPAPAARISVASLDALNRTAAELGIPLPDVKAQIEAMPFFGPGSVQTDEPGGLIILAGDALPSFTDATGAANAMIFAMPVVDGQSTLDDLTKAGATALDTPGLMKLGPFTLRRVPGYLLLQMGTPMGLAEFPGVQFAQDYIKPGNLAVIDLDLAIVRKMAPEGYKNWIQSIRTNTPAADAAEKWGQDLAIDLFNSIDHVSMALSEDGETLHLKSAVSPVMLSGTPTAMPRPVFPKDTILQMHVVYPNANASNWVANFMESIPNDAFVGMTPAEITAGKAGIGRLGKVMIGGSAFSAGIIMRDGKPVIYVVNQLDAPMDVAGEIKSVITSLSSPDDKVTQSFATYDSQGKSVMRWTLAPKDGGDKTNIDVLAVGNTVFYAVSPSEGKYIQELVDGGKGESSATFCEGSLNLGAALDVATATGVPLPPDLLASLKKAVTDRPVTWTVEAPAGNALMIDLSVPKPLIKDVMKILTGPGTP